jgi:hypothetical protein
MPYPKNTIEGSGVWWRSNRYEIRNGYIRPAPGASLKRFDPWKPQGTGGGTRPYLELVDLVRDVPTDRPLSSHAPVSGDLAQSVLEWCGRYGLLGLLPHNLLSLRIGDWHLTRSGMDWVTSGYTGSRSRWGPGIDTGPWEEVIVEQFGQGAEYSDLRHDWWFYFPEVDDEGRGESFPYGPPLQIVPLTKEFWEHYGEPLDRVVDVARYFANAVKMISRPRRRPVLENYGGKLDRRGAIKRLDQLVSCVAQGIDVDSKGHPARRMRSPSLLGHLVVQAIQDVAGGRIVMCPCGKLFASEHWKQKHHDLDCGNRYRVREFRKRQRRARPAKGEKGLKKRR